MAFSIEHITGRTIGSNEEIILFPAVPNRAFADISVIGPADPADGFDVISGFDGDPTSPPVGSLNNPLRIQLVSSPLILRGQNGIGNLALDVQIVYSGIKTVVDFTIATGESNKVLFHPSRTTTALLHIVTPYAQVPAPGFTVISGVNRNFTGSTADLYARRPGVAIQKHFFWLTGHAPFALRCHNNGALDLAGQAEFFEFDD